MFLDHSENPSPEWTVTLMSRVWFFWFDKIIWKGLRTTIENKDLWDLNSTDRYGIFNHCNLNALKYLLNILL